MAGLSGNRILDLVGLGLKHVYTERLRGMTMPEGAAPRGRPHARAHRQGDPRRQRRPRGGLMREHMADYGAKVTDRYPGLLDELVDWS